MLASARHPPLGLAPDAPDPAGCAATAAPVCTHEMHENPADAPCWAPTSRILMHFGAGPSPTGSTRSRTRPENPDHAAAAGSPKGGRRGCDDRPSRRRDQGLAEFAARIRCDGVSAVADATPSAETVTRTLSSLPASFVTGVYVASVAPEIGRPLRNHW